MRCNMFCRNELYCSELSEICLEGIEGMHPERELEQSNREGRKAEIPRKGIRTIQP